MICTETIRHTAPPRSTVVAASIARCDSPSTSIRLSRRLPGETSCSAVDELGAIGREIGGAHAVDAIEQPARRLVGKLDPALAVDRQQRGRRAVDQRAGEAVLGGARRALVAQPPHRAVERGAELVEPAAAPGLREALREIAMIERGDEALELDIGAADQRPDPRRRPQHDARREQRRRRQRCVRRQPAEQRDRDRQHERSANASRTAKRRLKPMLLHPPIERAARQPELGGGVGDVERVLLERALRSAAARRDRG